MYKVQRVSASQVKNFSACPRKWYFESVLKEKAPETEAQRNGSAVHAEIEAYLLTGEIRPSPWAEHVAVVAPFLPPAPVLKSVYIERAFEMKTFKKGPLWIGKIDILDASDNVLHVLDHKTSKKMKHCLSPEELSTDIQMNSYGYYALTSPEFSHKNRDTVKLSHNYIRIEGKPKVEQITVDVTTDTVKEIWNNSLAVVDTMCQVGSVEHWKKVDPNTAACVSYGGCPFRERCGFVTEVDRLIGGNNMSTSLLQKVRAAKLAKQQETQETQEELPMSILPPDAPSIETPVAFQPVAHEEAPVQTKKKGKALEVPAFHIYVDCLPLHGASSIPTPFEKIVAPLADKVAEENGVADLRFLKYGEGKARLAVLIAEAIPTFAQCIVVTSMASYSDIFLEAVIEHAALYVRALRG